MRRAKEHLHKAVGKIKQFQDHVTGRNLVEALNGYSEAFSEVLVGMDREMQGISRKLSTQASRIDELEGLAKNPVQHAVAVSDTADSSVDALHTELSSLTAQVRVLRIVAVASLCGVIAIAVFLFVVL